MDTKVILRWFSGELIERMEAKGVTHRQLAFNSRTMPHNIMEYMRASSFPNPWTLTLIADYLDCTIDELLGYEDTSFIRKRKRESLFSKYPSEDSFTPYLRERIIQQMNKQNMTTEILAQRSGVNLQTINRYLCVHSGMPRLAMLLRICDAFECTPSELIGY